MSLRVVRVIALCLVLATLPGCFVADELSKGNKIMDQLTAHSRKVEAKKKAEAAATAAAEKRQAAAQAKAKGYWDRAHAISPGDMSADIVGCRMHGSVQFMKAVDCRTRGGLPTTPGG